MSASLADQHSEWLSLVEISGPFLTLPVLKRALPLGLDPTPLPLVDDLRVAWSEVSDDNSLIPRWIRWVLHELLELPEEVVKEGTEIGPALVYTVPEHGVTMRPDFAIVDPDLTSGGPPARMLVATIPAGTKLDEHLLESKWSAGSVDRMAELCRGTGVRLGLVTNGDQWAVVDAPVGGATGVATWDASLWLEERLTLDAFTTLLGVRRFFSVADSDTLDAMLSESANAEAEVTDQLGKQVRSAVELLVDAMSRANRDRGGHLFDDLSSAEVYAAAVTVMMRLVFLLSAEERGLFLLGEETYDSTYAVSTLRGQLEEEANTYGEEVIARRIDAWHRLLATFRMVFGGARHENLRLPAYGGSLFDPDRFPFLEGRKVGQPWRSTATTPLPIDNRTVLHILGALQVLTFTDRRGVREARRLSFRALDVEQIGHVYEGLLDHSAVRTDEIAVGLIGKKEPEIALELLESEADQGPDQLVAYLVELTGLSTSAVEKALAAEPGAHDLERLTSACENDPTVAGRIVPYLGLLRLDLAELPVVYLPDSIYVTRSSDRRSSGTYYTPRVLAEEIVQHTLEPLVYSPGPAEGAEQSDWKLKSSAELLDLKICDMAMGSGAFLVATCRYVSARLLEAWESEGFGAGDPVPLPGGGSVVMPMEDNDQEILARRLVADGCLYGVDRNPMAVEMAKLSMWLITLAKDRPFTFVDHALRCGDSVLGITDLRQLDCLDLDPVAGRKLHGGSLFDPATRIEPLLKAALEKRRRLEAFPVIDIHDAERKRELFDESNALLDRLKVIGNIVVGAALSTAMQSRDAYENRLLAVAPEVVAALDPDKRENDLQQRLFDLQLKAEYWLDEGCPLMAPDRQCLHWPLEFPEVFLDRPRGGFDAIVGNPPFLGGTKISTSFGLDVRHFLARWIIGISTDRADLVVFFFHRAISLIGMWGCIGLLATNSVREGDSREAGLDRILQGDVRVYRAIASLPWPGSATVEISQVWLARGGWRGTSILGGRSVSAISASLTEAGRLDAVPTVLGSYAGISVEGSKPTGLGFILTEETALAMLDADAKNAEVVLPYLSGQDLNSVPDLRPSRWIIDFQSLSFEEAASYSLPMRLLEERVKPEREESRRDRLREYWWQHEHPALRLYRQAAALDRVIALARVSKTLAPTFVETGQRFSDKVIVFIYEDDAHLGILASTFHWWWAETWSPRLRLDPSYNPSDSFETFPQPKTSAVVGRCGHALESHRREIMQDRWEGLTKIYNRVHSSGEMAEDIVQLRLLHIELDHAVAETYGWDDLDLAHGFHDTRQGSRYTISPAARAEALDRLLELNHERHADEVAKGMHAKGKNVPGKSPLARTPDNQLRLGDAWS